jgi:glycosyl transferase, family 25
MHTSVIAFVINLDCSTDRMRVCSRQLEELGLAWQRIAAIEGASLGEPPWPGVDADRFERIIGRALSPNEIGCALSHVRAMQAFLDSKVPCAIILEDDFFVPDAATFPGIVDDLMRIPHAWDHVKLSGRRYSGAVPQARLRNGFILAAPIFRLSNAVGYLLNRRAARVILRALFPIDSCFDHLLDRPWRYEIRYRIVQPFPVVQNRSFRSTIASPRPPKFRLIARRHVLYYRIAAGLRRLAYNAVHGFFLCRPRDIA